MESFTPAENETVVLNNTQILQRLIGFKFDISSKIDTLEKTYMGCNVKVNYLEDSIIQFNLDSENKRNKVIEELAYVKAFILKQDDINAINTKKFKEFEISIANNADFKKRVNDIITNLQSRIDNIEANNSLKKAYIKKTDTLENKVKSLDTKLKTLEAVTDKDVIPGLMSDIEKQLKTYKASIDSRFSNSVKTAENRHIELTSKFKNLIDEIDMFRNSKSSSLDHAIDDINDKIKAINVKLSEIDVSKINKSIEIKVNKSDIENISNKIKENGIINTKNITDRISIIEEQYNALSNKNCSDRVSSLEQQIICQMTDIHSLSQQVHYNYSSPRLYSAHED